MSNAVKTDLADRIAIIGMCGRFPGAKNIEEFWRNLKNGKETITFFSDEQLLAAGIDQTLLDNPNYVKANPILEDIDLFDASFFDTYPKEAELIDPQHRIFLECAWHALENSGYNPDRYEGLIGVYAGCNMNRYLLKNLIHSPHLSYSVDDLLIEIGNEKDYLATRVSYKLNLKGPCINVQTACSTSLVAVDLACQGLMNYQCDMALAGGISVLVPQQSGYLYREEMILSPDGHCRAFDHKAKGTIFGSGVGIVVLKRLEEAIADGDSIHAVILGSAVNNDGSSKVGFTAPSIDGQASVIAMAQAVAGIEVETISYVETHGTGTQLGDPIEIAALTEAFRANTEKNGFCSIGSVKTNIGHLDVASGVAGLIKTVLALKHKQLPPSLHCEKPNPKLNIESSPFYVNTSLTEWERGETPLRAGVSNFGIGGTNAHMVIEEAPEGTGTDESRPYQLLLLSAKTESALSTMARNLAEYLRQNPNVNFADVAYTLKLGRKVFPYRRTVVCADTEGAISSLEKADSYPSSNTSRETKNTSVAFMFPGQGSQYVNMGLDLYKSEPVFRDEIDRCVEFLKPQIGIDLRELLYPNEEDFEAAAGQLTQTSITQPALFTIEYALAKLLMTWGLKPEVCIGHSIGEYAAACLAEIFSPEDALTMVTTRGRLMQSLPGGSMLAVSLPEEQIRPLLDNKISLAAINSPKLCVVSGSHQAIADLKTKLSDKDIMCKILHTSHAFHSEIMESILDEFSEQLRKVRFFSPRIPIISDVSGTWLTSDQALDPYYWVDQLRQPVRFADCVKELLNEPKRVLLEVGPGQTLTTLARQSINQINSRVTVSTMRHPKQMKSDVEFILTTLGKLWSAGIEVNWSGFYGDERRCRIPLPAYPFERQRYWIEPDVKSGISPVRSTTSNQPDDNAHLSVHPENTIDDPFISDQIKAKSSLIHENEIERIIADIWKKLLGLKHVGAKDDYFELGGDSLLATHMCAEIEKIFNKKIPLATLINASTVELLAKVVGDANWSASWSSAVGLQTNGSKPPLFCIHSAGGHILHYRDLSKHLGPDQPVYGIQSQGLDGEQPILTRVEEMAAYYIDEVTKIQPEGPYLLGGYCLGGTIALEMAQQLYSKGQKVALLALLETYNWANLPTQSFFDKTYYYLQKIDFHWRNLLLSESKSAFLQEKVKVAKIRSKVWAGMVKSKIIFQNGEDKNHNEALYELWTVNDSAADNYRPSVYPGKITLFIPFKEYAVHESPEASWSGIAEEGIDTRVLPVYPAGMLVEPFVRQLALELKKCISEAIEKGA
jgi:acyl transferase domain-containing protein/thioesterase domain-containing protein